MGKGIDQGNNNNNNLARTGLVQSREELTRHRIKRLKIVLALVSSYLAAEVIGGILTGSLALIADAGHMLTDAGGIALALFAVSFTRKSPTPQQTYGFYRAEILATLANSETASPEQQETMTLPEGSSSSNGSIFP